MPIRSGTTRERLIRLAIFGVMCAVASALFLRDAFYGYPRANAAQARDEFPEIMAELPRINADVTEDRCKRIEENQMTLEEAEQILGEPAFSDDREAFWVGPSGFVKADLKRSGVISKARWNKGRHTSRDLAVQTVLGALAGFLAIPALVFLVRAAGTCVLLDEKGLTYNREETILWEEMKGLDASLFKRKGRVTLDFERGGNARGQRLDSFHVARFDDIVSEICQRKGFESPLKKAEAKSPSETSTGQPTT